METRTPSVYSLYERDTGELETALDGQILYAFRAGLRPPVGMLLHASRHYPDLSFRLSWWANDDDNSTVVVEKGTVVSIDW